MHSQYAAWPSFNLTTVQRNVDEMVETTRAILFDQIGGQAWARRVAMPCELSMQRGNAPRCRQDITA
jgi:DNA-binding LacI/PurR family transcriptional regulator